MISDEMIINTRNNQKEKKITNSCIICGYGKDPCVSYFTFPKDPERKKEWIRSLKVPNSLDVFHRRVCSRHFNPEDFYMSGNVGRRVLLKKTAVPQLYESFNEKYAFNSTRHYSANLIRFRRNHCVDHSCYICGATEDKSVLYYKFPTEPSVQFFWIEACNISTATSVDNLFLCDKHFLDSDFTKNEKDNENKLFLKRNAIPTLLMEHSPKEVRKNTHSCILCGSSKSEKLSYFGFPKTEEMKSLWEKACGFQMSKIDYQYRICSKHFVSNDFTNEPKAAKRLRLKKTSVPSLHLSAQRKSVTNKNVNDENIKTTEISGNPSGAETKLDSPNVSDSDSQFLEIPAAFETDEIVPSEEVIVNHEYSAENDISYLSDYIEEIIPPIQKIENEAERCIQLQRILIKKQQKHIEMLEQQLRKARQKIRILEGLGVPLQQMKKGTENTTVYVMVV